MYISERAQARTGTLAHLGNAVGPLIAGVIVVLIMSISPIRSVNGLLCFGVVLGGFVAGMLQAKTNGNRLESTRGLLLGARVGVIAAIIVIAFDLLVAYVPSGLGVRAGVDYLDPIPKYIYLAIYGIYDGMLDIVRRGEAVDGLEWPGRVARYIILISSSVLFAGMGGGIAASTFFGEPNVAGLPGQGMPAPVLPGQMRPAADRAIQIQPAQEAAIFPTPFEPISRPAAATGTYGPPIPIRNPWVGLDRTPVFDQAAQLQQASRPRGTISLTAGEVAPTTEPVVD